MCADLTSTLSACLPGQARPRFRARGAVIIHPRASRGRVGAFGIGSQRCLEGHTCPTAWTRPRLSLSHLVRAATIPQARPGRQVDGSALVMLTPIGQSPTGAKSTTKGCFARPRPRKGPQGEGDPGGQCIGQGNQATGVIPAFIAGTQGSAPTDTEVVARWVPVTSTGMTVVGGLHRGLKRPGRAFPDWTRGGRLRGSAVFAHQSPHRPPDAWNAF
jgi:hypothetical protein